MAESIHDIAVKLGIDASGVGAGLGKASDYLAGWYDSYRKVMEAARRVANIESQQHDTHVQERRQREEQFNNWYRKAQEEEFQAWYAIELKKEKVIQDRIAEERQSRINQFNAAAQTAVMPAESAERTAEMANLREYITQKYTVLNEADEAEQRLLRDNAVNSRRQLERKAAGDDAARNAELAALREDITARQTLYKQEEAAAEAAAESRMLELRARRLYGEGDAYDNPNDREQRRAAQARRVEADANAAKAFAAEEREANAVIRANMSLMDRYNEQRSRLLYLSSVIDPATKKNILSTDQYNRAVTNLTISTIRHQQAEARRRNTMQQTSDTARIMTGVFAQASFAAEDFIQGMVFGDARSALLGASNNLTMVVRGLLEASKASATFAANLKIVSLAVGIPALIVGTAVAVTKLYSALRDTRSLSEFLREATYGLNGFNAAVERLQRQQSFKLSIAKIDSSEQAGEDMQRRTNELAASQQKLQNLQRNSVQEGMAAIDHMLGGANARLELEKQIEKTIAFGSDAERKAAAEARALLMKAQQEAAKGNAENVIFAMRGLHDILSSKELRNWTEWIDDMASLDALQDFFNPRAWGAFVDGLGEGADKILEIKETIKKNQDDMNEQQKLQAQIATELLDLELRRLELIERERIAREQQRAMDQDRINSQNAELLFMAKATEAQKALYEMRKQQSELLSPAATIAGLPGVMGLAGGMQLAHDMMLNQMLMQARADELQKKITDETDEPGYQDALMQNAWEAKANAQKQVFEAQFQKKNPQLEAMLEELRLVKQAIQNGGLIQVVK